MYPNSDPTAQSGSLADQCRLADLGAGEEGVKGIKQDSLHL